MGMRADIHDSIQEMTNILCQRLARGDLNVYELRKLMNILEAEIYIDLDWSSLAKEKIIMLQKGYGYHDLDCYLKD